jgi:hypothetical protein
MGVILLNRLAIVSMLKGIKFPSIMEKLRSLETATMLSPVPDLANNWQFSEIWVDSTAIPPYILLLLGDKQGNCSIYDPKENYRLVFACSSYQEAKLWLLEDEYEQIKGRLEIDEAA